MKPTTNRPQDTLIQRKSKEWVSKTVLAGEPANLMVAYQMGAKQMEEDIVRVMFDKCKEKEDNWDSCKDCYGCSLYCGIIKLFNK